MFSDIFHFLWAVASKLIYLLTGGALMAIVTGVERLRRKPTPKVANWVILAVTLLATFFLVWQDEYHRANRANQITVVPVPGRAYTGKTPKQLMAPVNSRKWTEVQLQAMVAPDLGKWITVAAPILDMDAGHLLLDASDDWSPLSNIVLISVPLPRPLDVFGDNRIAFDCPRAKSNAPRSFAGRRMAVPGWRAMHLAEREVQPRRLRGSEGAPYTHRLS